MYVFEITTVRYRGAGDGSSQKMSTSCSVSLVSHSKQFSLLTSSRTVLHFFPTKFVPSYGDYTNWHCVSLPVPMQRALRASPSSNLELFKNISRYADRFVQSENASALRRSFIRVYDQISDVFSLLFFS